MTFASCPEKLQNKEEMGEAAASLDAATEISVDSVVAVLFFFYQDWMEFLHLQENKEQH